MKDCYRTYDDLRALLQHGYEDYRDWIKNIDEGLEPGAWGFADWVTKWLVDNGYEVRKYEVDAEDVPKKEWLEGAQMVVGPQLLKDVKKFYNEPCHQAETKEGLDVKDLFIPPAKLDRCPEDILKEQIETEEE